MQKSSESKDRGVEEGMNDGLGTFLGKSVE